MCRRADATLNDEAPRQVRFLAPFDPVVWDRARFEHLWGWAYRFEAYTPVKKRVRGYYAMPMLWGDQIDRMGQCGCDGVRQVRWVRGVRGVRGVRDAVTLAL